MFEALIGAAASAGSSAMGIGGGLIDHFLNRDASDDAFAKSQHYSQRAIRDRVRDAELAGIHPLYALGASTSTPSPMVFESRLGESMSRAGQDLGGAIFRSMDKVGRERALLENALLNAQILKTQAERNLSEQEFIRLMDRNGTPSSGMSVDYGSPPVSGQQDSGLYKVVPPDRSTTPPGMPGVESGAGPAFKKYTLPLPNGGLEAMLPQGTDLGETLENIKWYMWPTIYKVNKQMYGEAHADKLYQWANPFSDIRVFKKKLFPAFRK